MKYLILLMLDTALVGGLYYYLVYTLMLPYVMQVYLVIALLSVFLYTTLCMHHNNEIALARLNGKEVPKELCFKRKRRLKLIIAFLFPFVLTIMVDFLYLLLFVDNPYVTHFINSLKQL